jgi:hypothetical protein
MAYDIYSTGFLNRVVDDLAPVPSVFLDLFFPDVLTHDTEEVYFDKVSDKPRLTPFVHPLHEGKVVDSIGYATKSVKPAYVKDLRVHNPLKALKRRAGESLTGSLSPAQRQQANIVADLADQNRMFARRLEVMAIEAVRDGKQTIVGEGFNAVIDFGRDASLTETLLTNDRWSVVDANAPDIPAQLENWSQQVADFDGAVDAVIMDVKAWNLFRKAPSVKGLLEIRRGVADTDLMIDPMTAIKAGVQYKGSLGSFQIWVYTGSYIDPADGNTKKYMPDNTVVLAGRRVEGVRHFGAIMDVDVLVARERYAQSWVEKNPSRRMLMMESAPLLVPYRPNSSKKVTVI